MAIKIGNADRKERRGTAASATSNNPILLEGGWGYETDTGKLKIGDGVTAWTSLPYVAAPNVVTGERYDTGWTVVGATMGAGNSININHGLNSDISELIVNGSVRDPASPNTILDLDFGIFNAGTIGQFFQGVDANNIKIQIGDTASSIVDSSGTTVAISSTWEYKVVLVKLTIN